MTWQNKANSSNLDTVLTDICARKEPPNSEQRNLLEAFVERLKTERLEDIEHKSLKETEPLFDIIHGYPGTGKSRVIAWLRELMEEGLGWAHGIVRKFHWDCQREIMQKPFQFILALLC